MLNLCQSTQSFEFFVCWCNQHFGIHWHLYQGFDAFSSKIEEGLNFYSHLCRKILQKFFQNLFLYDDGRSSYHQPFIKIKFFSLSLFPNFTWNHTSNVSSDFLISKLQLLSKDILSIQNNEYLMRIIFPLSGCVLLLTRMMNFFKPTPSESMSIFLYLRLIRNNFRCI